MIKLNTKGSSPLHIVLIFVIVGLIAGIGYYVYNSQKKTNTALDNAANSQADPQKSNKKGGVETKVVEKNEESGFFEIKELGVKFKPTSSLGGLYYTVGNGGKTVYFSLEELKSTDCAADKTAQVALTRYTEQDFAEDTVASPIKEKSKKFDQYYFFAMGGQSMCSEDSTVQEKASNLRTEILKQLPNSLVKI
jgi:preprotein translocase subunit YajC